MWGVHLQAPPFSLCKEPVWFPNPLVLGQKKNFSKDFT